MKILYGVVGEGMGHAIRSNVMVEHLLGSGHEVEIMASSRAAEYLGARHHQAVRRIHGLQIITEDNRMRPGRTVVSNVASGAVALPQQIASYFKLVEEFRPEVVVTDFESWTYFYAKARRIPVISIDNNQIVNRCRHDSEITRGHRTSFEITRTFIKSKLPFCSHYIITTYFFPPSRRDDTTLVPPILRPVILGAQTVRGDHLLVYQTAEGHRALAEALQRTGLECRIYGMRRSISEEQVEGRLRYRPFDEQVFVEDLRTARAVIAGGGFTVLSECVYLRKPVLSVPIAGQFEQIMNGRYLARLGYGHYAEEADEGSIHAFLEALPDCERALLGYQQAGNELALAALDRELARAATHTSVAPAFP